MEALALLTDAPTEHQKDNTIFIYVDEDKIVTTIVKHIGTNVFFLQEKIDNGIFVPNYEKYNFVPADMCTKPCLGPIISRSTKRMTEYRILPNH